MKRLLPALIIALALGAASTFAQSREEKVRNDRQKVETEGYWIYNDLPRAFENAKQSGKPIIVLLRCIPCVECVKLDDDLVNQDPSVKPLLDKFVRVRVISTNGLDLSLFQFDTDQSSAVFLLNADGTIYGRYGTRSHHKEFAGDLAIEGLGKALEGALALHADYPKNKAALAGKRGGQPEFAVPEKYPTLAGKYTDKLNYEGEVVKSCIHCHQIGDAQRRWYHDESGAIPESVLFQYPHPKAIGLILDPKECATVARVEPNTPAAASGLQKGDVIKQMNGQPLLSIADVQWVLHQSNPQGTTVKASVERAGKPVEVSLALPKGWRQRDDISWRASSWELRRVAIGALKLNEMTADELKAAGLTEKDKALRVEHVGQYSPHDIAKKAGFQKNDIVLAFDGKPFERETDIITYALRDRKPGDSIAVDILRGGKKQTLTLPIAKN